MAKEILCGFGIDVDAVVGWLGSYGGEASPDDISRGLFAGEVGSPRLLKLFARAWHKLELGERLALGYQFLIASSREQAIREAAPNYEENMKMFGELRLVRALTDEQIAAMRDPRLAGTVKLPRIEDAVNAGGFLAGRPEDIIEQLKPLEKAIPASIASFAPRPSASRSRFSSKTSTASRRRRSRPSATPGPPPRRSRPDGSRRAPRSVAYQRQAGPITNNVTHPSAGPNDGFAPIPAVGR
jgi:hypothetical protein